MTYQKGKLVNDGENTAESILSHLHYGQSDFDLHQVNLRFTSILVSPDARHDCLIHK